ncbi:MAG TPA: rhodanese-like domain-containing protein [Sulfuricurvum sp.]|nr:rhodanese-like domain-containing protein [Sulfuricurvum sp.]
MLLKIHSLILASLLSVSTLSAVEYDGEKSYMLDVKYDICIIPPQEKDAAAKGINVISVKQAKNLYDQKASFYDAREKRHYNKQHIKGAKLVDFDRSKAEYMVINLPKDKEESLVFYCYGESCANSYEAALAVKKLGYKNVYWLLNGYNDWIAKRYPVQ